MRILHNAYFSTLNCLRTWMASKSRLSLCFHCPWTKLWFVQCTAVYQ